MEDLFIEELNSYKELKIIISEFKVKVVEKDSVIKERNIVVV